MSIAINHDDYIDFWAEAAEKNLNILHDRNWRDEDSTGTKQNHFARVIDSSGNPFNPNYYLEELLNQQGDNLKFPAVVVESLRTKYDKPSGVRASAHGALIVLLNTDDRGDYDSQNSAVAQGQELCSQLMSYLKKFLDENPMEARLDIGSIVLNPVGPVLDLNFGGRVDFELEYSANSFLCYDEDQWVAEE